jgi:RimJ/RimL family protein N-acetyltransferase
MRPATLTTERLVLDQPTLADVELIARYCSDPLFEHVMTTPWPYERKHAVHFVESYVPIGWEDDNEYTWAIRLGGDFVGMIGYRTELETIGFWLGEPHRGSGIMTEAATAAIEWVFGTGRSTVRWECVEGNVASTAVARKLGFSYTGAGPGAVAARTGEAPPSWHATLAATDSRDAKPGWPIP